MAISKIEIIIEAYVEIKISGITSDPTPEDLEYALIKLESMASEFEEMRNICLGYVFEDEPDPNTETALPLYAKQAYATNLAVRLLAAFGKQASPALVGQASQSMSILSSKAFQVKEVQYPTRQPRGSGDTLRYSRWARFYRANPQAPVTCDTKQIERGEINDYSTDLTNYLKDGETITSYQTQNTAGLTITNNTLDVSVINYRVECSMSANDLEIVVFDVTTSTGRVRPFQVNFNVSGLKDGTLYN